VSYSNPVTLFSSALTPDRHSDGLKRLATENFDILVIGGGINGVGIALDAASRGFRVALVEAHDLASGTSSRSSKLIHGGLRYLAQYDFKLVREALRERELMVTTLAPHLVKPVSFLYPLHEKFKERTYVGAGLALYDALRGFKRALPWHKHLNQERLAEVAPSLRLDIITGGIQYFDAHVDDARHTMMVARTAAKHGALIATRVRCEKLIRDDKKKKVIGAQVRCLESNELIDVSAKVTIMAVGVWTDEFYDQYGLTPGYRVRMSKGAHIVLPGDAIRSESGIILKTPTSVLFIIPWSGKWIIGTTDTDYRGNRDEPLATKEDVEYILTQANRVLEPELRREDVIAVYAGLRPLISESANSPTTKLSREHIVDHPIPGFVSIAGGKYTTYRIMAQDAVDVAVEDLRRLVPASCTQTLPLVGAEGYQVLKNKIKILSEDFALSEATITHLLDRYGSLIEEIIELIGLIPSLALPVVEGEPYIKAEIYYAASHEGARSVEDVIARRTRLSFELSDHGSHLAESVAEIIGPLLGWSQSEKIASVTAYIELVAREKEALGAITAKETKESAS